MAPGADEGHPAGDWLAVARRAVTHVFVDDIGSPQLADADRHHLERVLRVRTGEVVSVADGRGGWRRCLFGDGGQLVVAGDIVVPPRPLPDLTVGFAVTKGDRPEWAVQKLTEIGIDRIIPLHSGRSVVRWDGDRAERHLSRLREVGRLAAMQSRRLRLPVIGPVQSVASLLDPTAAWASALALATPGGHAPTLSRPMIVVGPEGGWTPDEEAAAPATVDLGPSMLRTETAALVGASLLSALRHSLVSTPHVLR